MTERVRDQRRNRLAVAAQLRVVIYARKSGPGDKSITDQEKVGRRDVESIGGVVVAVFTDNLSASRYRRVQERPGFIETKKFIRCGDADVLWTFANNRAHRTLDDYVELRSLCVETGSLWRYGGRTYDLTKSADRQATAADALRSEGQSDDISEAVNRGIQEALDANKAHGKLLRGYRIIRDENTGKAITRVPIPKQAKLIEEAADRVLAGETLRAVARDFVVAWKAVDGKGFVDQRVLRTMLINPTYAGLRTYKGKEHGVGNWTPILTLEKHRQLRELLMNPRRKMHRGTAPEHLLSYIAICKVCATRVTAKTPRKGGRAYAPTYRCPDGHVSRRIGLVDNHIEELLLQLLEAPATLAKLTAPSDEEQASVEEDLDKIGQLRSEIKTYVKDAAKTKMSAAAVAVYVEELEGQIAEAQARVDAMTKPVDPVLSEIVGPGARNDWAGYDIVRKREVIRRSMQVVIHPINRRGRYSDIGVTAFEIGALARLS